jgi:hypothetical protein
VAFHPTDAYELARRLVKAGIAPGQAELLITREWAIMAGENEPVTSAVRANRPRTTHYRTVPPRESRPVPLKL